MSYTRSWMSACIAVLCLCTTPLLGSWSMPSVVVYPPAPPYNATSPSIATDGQGNCVAVWVDTSCNRSLQAATKCTGSLQAATLASGAVNEQGQPAWVLTNPIFTSNVQAPATSFAQMVGMDTRGNTTAVWTDIYFVYASTLAPGQTTWSSSLILCEPITGATTINLSITVAANGNAIAVWRSLLLSESFILFANVYDAGSQSWKGPVAVLTTNPGDYPPIVNGVAIDPKGNAVISINTAPDTTQAISYLVNSNTFTQIPSLNNSNMYAGAVTIDPAGNATVVWIEFMGTINAATLPFQQTSLTNKTILSTRVNIYGSSSVIADGSGNAIAAWTDGTGNLASARFSFATKNWTVLPLFDLGEGPPVANISLSSDAQGNVVASWSRGWGGTSSVETATLAAGSSAWTQPTQLSTASEYATNPQSMLTTQGNGVIVWQVRADEVTKNTQGTINSSNFINLYDPPPPNLPDPPLPPSAFAGTVIKNVFLAQTDRIHALTWVASTDPTVVQYYLYRNSTLIATLPAGGSTFSYEDHNRSKKVSDIYSLVSVDGQGNMSPPLFVTLK